MVTDRPPDRVSSAADGNPFVGFGHRWWFVLERRPATPDERADALEWLSEKLRLDLAWVVFPTGGFRL